MAKTQTVGELFREGDYYLVKRIEEVTGSGKNTARETGYYIKLYDVSASVVRDFPYDEDGLSAALQESATGDTVWVPGGTITLTAAVSVPAGVTLKGDGIDRSNLTCTANITDLITLGAASTLSDMTVNFTSSSGSGSKAVFLQQSSIRNLKVIKSETGGGSVNYGIEGDLYTSTTEKLCSAENIWCYVSETSGNGTNHRAINFDSEIASAGVVVKNIVGVAETTNAAQDAKGVFLDGEAANEIWAYNVYGSATAAASNATVYGLDLAYTHIWNGEGVATCAGSYAEGITAWNSYLYSCTGSAELTASGSDNAVGITADGSTLTNCIGSGTGGGGTPTVYGIDVDNTVYLYNTVGIGATADLVGGGAGDTLYVYGVQYDTLLDTNNTINFLSGDAGVIGGNLVIGSGAAATDYTLTFDGETNDVVLTGMEDEKCLKLDSGFIQTPDEITATDAGVAASIQTINTEVTTNGDTDLDNVTLANGVSGQIKHIYCVVEGNAADTWKITPATMCGGTQITFAGVGEGCTLVYADSEGWVVVANNGGTIT